MIEPECKFVVEPPTELEPPSNKSVTAPTTRSAQGAGRIKSDWWNLRADLKPMSEYRMNRSSFK